MGDWASDHSQSLLVSFAELLHQFYFSKIGRTTFYTVLLVSQGALLAIVAHSFLASVQLSTQLSVSIARLTSYLRLQLQPEGMNQIPATIVRIFITFLNLTVAASLLALFIKRKQQSLLCSFMQKYLHYLMSTLLTLSVPFLYFSINHIFADNSFQAYISDIIDAINAVFLMGCIYALQFFGVEVGSSSPNTSIFRNYRNNSGISKIIKLGATFLLAVQTEGLQAGLICLLLLEVKQLKCLCQCRKYMNAQLQSLSELVSAFWISSSLVMLFATNFPTEIMTGNLGCVFMAVTALLYASVRSYIKDQRRGVMVLSEGVENQEQAIAFAWQYLANLNVAGQRGDMAHRLLIALSIEKHQARCENVRCRCQEKGASFGGSSDLVKIVTEEIFQGLLAKFPYSFCLKFMALWFKMSHSLMIVNINHEIGQFLKRKNVKGFSFAEKFILNETRKRIKTKLLDYNCTENHIKAENIFLEQAIKNNVEQLIGSIIQEMLGKHKLLLQDFYSLNAVESFCLRINQSICAMEQIWRRVCYINSFNHQLYRIFIFYYQNVVPSQVEGKKITREIMLKLDKLKHLRGFSKDIINKYIYSRKSCVIQSNLERSFGVITNVSKYSLQVLGRTREELLNKDINSVMPEYFARSHQQSMRGWIQNCTISKYQTEIVEIGYVDAMQTCFQGCFLMKIFPGEEQLLFYSVIIRENDNDYILLNHHQEIQGIGRRLIKENVFTSDNLKHKLTQYGSFNFDKRITALNQKFRAKIFLQNTQSQRVGDADDDEKSLESSSKRLLPSMYRYECTVSISKHSIARQFYYLIKFQNVTKWVSSSSKNIQTLQIGQRAGGSSDRMGSTLKLIEDELQLVEEYESVQPVTNNIRFTQLLNLSIKNSSLASNGFSETAYYNHFIKDVKRRLIDPALLRLPPFRKLTALLLLLAACMTLQFFSLRVLFEEGFRSFNDVMFGDGAVSDNNQILEFLYNDVHMSRIYCGQQPSSPRCQYLLDSTSSLSQILYELYLTDVQVYLQNRTTLSGIKFYASYDIPVSFSLSQGSSEQISTLQFMEYFYGAVKKLHNEVAAGRAYSIEADVAMGVLLGNWETMKFVNHNAIYYYLDAGQVELDMLLDYLLILGASLLFCIIALGVGLKGYENSLLKKKVDILAIHGCMNDQLLRDLTDYYFYLKEITQDLKFLPDKFEPTTEDHTHHENRREMKYSQSRLCLMQILIVVLVVSLLGGLEILKVGLVLPSCMLMVQKINDLMDSENFLLENYFQLKTYYLTSNFSKSVDQITQEIAVHLNQTDPVFNQVAKGSIDIFSSDPTFTQDFNDLLINDVCELAAWVFQPWEVLYCMHNFTTPVLKLGLVNAMTFFQRNAFAALTELQAKQEQNINKTAYFQQEVFEDIDDSIFYMFRLYQATQARMYQGLSYSVNSSLPYLQALNAAAISILVFVVCWWLKGYRGQQREMSQLYGTVLQFPEVIMKPEIIAKIKNILELEH